MPVTDWNHEQYTAAGYGRRYAWIDFVNSQYWDGFGNSTDYLDDQGWQRTFLKATGLRTKQRKPLPLRAFKKLRTSLRLAANEIIVRRDLSTAIIGRLNDALSNAVFRVIERSNGVNRLELHPKREDWQWIRAQIVASFAAFLESTKTHRLKVCPNRECRWLFFDETRGNTKRWCNDRLCGNRDKVRRYRAAHRGDNSHSSIAVPLEL